MLTDRRRYVRAGAARRRPVRPLLGAAALVALLAGCSDEPEVPQLLDMDDVPGAVSEDHEPGRWVLAGQGWCGMSTGPIGDRSGPYSRVGIGESRVQVEARIASNGPYEPAAELMAQVEADVQRCVDYLEERAAAGEPLDRTIEPLTGLDDGVLGWRTRETPYGDSGDVWSEFALVQVTESKVLVVGVQTDEEEPPIDIEDLLAMALENAERLALDE